MEQILFNGRAAFPGEAVKQKAFPSVAAVVATSPLTPHSGRLRFIGVKQQRNKSVEDIIGIEIQG